MNQSTHTQNGFTFIEVMLAVVIISIAALGLMMGAVHAHGELQSVAVREQVTEALVNEMEYWKGRVADGKLSVGELMGNREGKEFELDLGDGTTGRIPAKLRIHPIVLLSGPNPTNYLLNIEILWEDDTQSRQGVIKRRSLQMVMTEFPEG